MNKLEKVQLKIVSANELNKMLNIWRFKDEQIIFTNGCFDLLHLGHIDYLAKAANLGDKLIVALNSDQSISALKGPNRPITNERSRSAILAALFFVDAVILFDEETPLKLIETVRPDILVKGADYTIDRIVGAGFVLAAGGQVKTIEFMPGYSTSLIEQKIKIQ